MTELRTLPERMLPRADATLARAVLLILLVKPVVLVISIKVELRGTPNASKEDAVPNLSFTASAPNAGAREPVGSCGGLAVKLAIAVGRGAGLDEIYK
jgi:hypothetical protein